MTRLLSAALLLSACGGQDPTCDNGFEAGGDGLCYQTTDDPTDTGTTPTSEVPFAVRDWLQSLPDCGLPAGDGELDLATGCAGSACGDMTYDAINTALGETGACERFAFETPGFSQITADCSWSIGIEANFDDMDDDGAPDPTSTAFSLYLVPPFAGTTTDGIGIETPMECLVPLLGLPSGLSFDQVVGGYALTALDWAEHGLYVYDFSGADGSFGSDGLADRMSVYGSNR